MGMVGRILAGPEGTFRESGMGAARLGMSQ